MAPPSSEAQQKPARSSADHVNGQGKKQKFAPAPAPVIVSSTNRPHVIPAIPLAYMNKQSNTTGVVPTKPLSKHTSAASASSNRFPASSLEAALIPRDVHSNKHSEKKVENQVGDISTPIASPPYTTGQQLDLSRLQLNGVDHTGTVPVDGAGDQVKGVRGEPYGFSPLQSPNENSTYSRSAGVNGSPSFASQPHSASSMTRPEFTSSVPAPSHLQQHQHHVADQHHPAFHAPHPHHRHLHQHVHQISNGNNIMFGGFDSLSHTPSPAPHRGSFMPPPPPINGESRGHTRLNGHHHAHSNSNGFPAPINTHFRGDMASISAMDGYGAVPAPGPPVHMEAYAPGSGRYGPPTPHSFHGSHTSGELNGVDSASLHYPPHSSYAPQAHREHHISHPPPIGPFPPFIPPQPMSRQLAMAEDEVMEGVRYIRSLFDNVELADCVLELISAKGSHHPVKISGHKLVLARSPALKQRILTARSNDREFHTITLEIDDPYLRSDAWWMAVQHLYQHPLFQLPPMLNGTSSDVGFAGDKADRFGFCLGYAAAGHVLAMQDVFIRGLQIAASALAWETVEAGLGFVLENTIQRHLEHNAESEDTLSSTVLEFGYGPETKILLAALLNFLVTEFPSNFELDTLVLDNPKTARIPMSAAATAAPARVPPTDNMSPTIVQGTATRQPLKPTRLSSIKFGDLPAAYPDDPASTHREPAKCSSVLSRILLNLPFDELCQVLTSGSNSVSGWNTAQDRYHAVSDVVAEREARRLCAVEAVRSGAVPNAREVQLRLSTPHRYTTAAQWDVLNWKEEVIHGETPRIERRWIPQFDVTQPPTQPRLTPLYYDIPDSMV